MPDIKEKLVELLVDFNLDTNNHICDGCGTRPVSESCVEIADYLIANGVTVQEHDGCAYCKEDRDGYRGVFGAFSLSNPFHGDTWYIGTGHCKPRQIYFCPMCGRKLSEPPKGE